MNSTSPKPWCLNLISMLLAFILAASGLFFVIEGAKLLSLHGSAYFLISGLIMLAGAVLLSLGLASGATLVVVNALFTLIWALWDAGLQFWPLVSRLVLPSGFSGNS